MSKLSLTSTNSSLNGRNLKLPLSCIHAGMCDSLILCKTSVGHLSCCDFLNAATISCPEVITSQFSCLLPSCIFSVSLSFKSLSFMWSEVDPDDPRTICGTLISYQSLQWPLPTAQRIFSDQSSSFLQDRVSLHFFSEESHIEFLNGCPKTQIFQQWRSFPLTPCPHQNDLLLHLSGWS